MLLPQKFLLYCPFSQGINFDFTETIQPITLIILSPDSLFPLPTLYSLYPSLWPLATLNSLF